MAKKTGDTPKDKPKTRASRTARPSFTPASAPAASSAWVYRSDAPSKAPTAASAPRALRLTHVLDVVTLPIAVSLMAVLAPVRWLLGPPSRH